MTGDLLSMAEPAVVQRGRDYAASGLVSDVRRRSSTVRATVHGTLDYTVTLDAEDGDCDCPHARDGNICKHMVAVALVAGQVHDPVEEDEPDLGSYLETLSREELIDLLLSAADEDEELEHRLALAAADATGDVKTLRGQVDALLRTRRFLDWRDASTYARKSASLVDALARAATRATADHGDVIAVVERAIGHVVKVIHQADDSSGDIGELIGDLLTVHADACAQGHPDPIKLARWLARFTLEDQDIFTIDIRQYTTTLGKLGLATYRAAVNQRLVAEPGNFAATNAAQRLAVLDRDDGAVVRLFGGDLQSTHQYVLVAKAMIEIKRYDDAMAFARRGMDLPPNRSSRELFDLAATLHTKAGELDEVVAIRQRGLTAIPDLQSYTALRESACKVGQWTRLRSTAVSALAAQAPHEHVRALLSDDDIDAAWAAATERNGGGADSATMRRLVERRAETSPSDAIPYLRAFAEEALRVTDRDHYRECARWLVVLRAAHERAGTAEDFASYVAQLREANRRRPAFLDELFRARL